MLVEKVPPPLDLEVIQLEYKPNMGYGSSVAFSPLGRLLARWVQILERAEPSAHR